MAQGAVWAGGRTILFMTWGDPVGVPFTDGLGAGKARIQQQVASEQVHPA